MLVFSGVQFIGCLVLPLQQVYLTCLGMVKIGLPQTQFACFDRSISPCIGQSGSQEMISFLTKDKTNFFASTVPGDILALWTQLQHLDEHKTFIVEACRLLEPRAMFLFASHGWSFSYRLGH